MDLGRRIVIIGQSGSGKTTLAGRLARRFELPHIELDALNNLENWRTPTTEEFREAVALVAGEDAWVIDGNYAKARDLIWPRATSIVWLDYPIGLVLWRLNRRIWRRGLRREVLWNGNRETIWRHFLTRESLFWWVITTQRRRRREFFELLVLKPSETPWVRFRTPAQAEVWLRSLGA